jgi:hypothetical protein
MIELKKLQGIVDDQKAQVYSAVPACLFVPEPSPFPFQIQNLKDENLRKSKFLTSLKYRAVIPSFANSLRASKAAEAVSLEQWKREYHECDEKLRRFALSLSLDLTPRTPEP